MLTNYKSQCESKVKKWIEDTIDKEQFKYLGKDKFENLALQDYQEFVVDCKVEVTHTLNAEYTEEKVAGNTDKQGEFVSSKEEYEKAIKQHLADELNSPKSLKLLFDTMKQNEYAQYTEKNIFATASTILYEHTCPTCKGNSEQRCTECRGQGEIRCWQCGGKGEYRCSKCNGKGEVECKECYGKGKEKCWACKGSGEQRTLQGGTQRCNPCKGTGYGRECSRCKGKGIVWCEGKGIMWGDRCKGGFIECSRCYRTGFVKCSSCDGTTMVKCKTCNGTNKIVEIAQIQLTTTPTYTQSYADNVDEKLKQIIENTLQNGIADIANITRTELRQDESEKRVVEIYQIQMPCAKFNVSFGDKKFTWLVYGKNLQVEGEQVKMLQAFKDYNTEQEAEKQKQEIQKLEKDVDILAKFAEKSSLMDLSFIKKSQPMVEVLMKSQINQNIIQADIDDNSSTYENRINSIQNELKNKSAVSLSKEYIEKVINTFDTIADNFCSSVTITALILAFVVSCLVAFFMPLFIPLGWSIISTALIFAFFMQFGEEYRTKKIAKCWGEKLYLWVKMLGYIDIKYARLYNTIGIVAVYLVGSYVNAANLGEMFDSTPTAKQVQTTQKRQTQQPQQQKPTLITPKCNDSGALADIQNAQRQGILKTIEEDSNLWAGITKRNQTKGAEFASVAEYVSGMRLDYSHIETNVRDEVRHRVECSARLSVNHSLMSKPQIWAFRYTIQATEQNNKIDIMDYKPMNDAQSATEPSQSVNADTPSNESVNSSENVAQNALNQNIQASFDCAKASTRVEKLICSDSELASLDIELANVYANTRNSLDTGGKKALLNEQRKWIDEYNQCADKFCVQQQMQERIRALQNYSSKAQGLRLKTNDEYVNLRQSPSGEIITPIYKSDFDKISLKKLETNGKWIKVLYFAPNVSDEKDAITGYIHISQIDENSL